MNTWPGEICWIMCVNIFVEWQMFMIVICRNFVSGCPCIQRRFKEKIWSRRASLWQWNCLSCPCLWRRSFCYVLTYLQLVMYYFGRPSLFVNLFLCHIVTFCLNSRSREMELINAYDLRLGWHVKVLYSHNTRPIACSNLVTSLCL